MSLSSPKVSVDYPGVRFAWERVLAIAQNLPDPMSNEEDCFNNSPNILPRMQHMGSALENIFIITSQDEGYFAFISTMMQVLKYDCPVSMAFVKHVLDFSEIPAPSTIKKIAETVKTSTNNNIRINQFIVWSLLARRFAGNLAEILYKDEVATALLDVIDFNSNSSTMLCLFSMLALESFALTGSIKTKIMTHSQINIIDTLHVLLRDTQERIQTMELSFQQSPPKTSLSSIYYYSPNLTLTSSTKEYTGKRFYHSIKRIFSHKKLFKKKSKCYYSNETATNPTVETPLALNIETVPETVSTSSSSTTLVDELLADVDTEKTVYSKNEAETKSHNNSVTTHQPTTWTELKQFEHVIKWSLQNVFYIKKASTLITPPQFLNMPPVYLNPKDCTSHCKLSMDCLEVRNDTCHLESIRANTGTQCGGKYFYEVTLLTNGVMQIGWSTTHCVFLPEEGCGVGDDSNGFAFDTFRSAVWAAGEAIFPKEKMKYTNKSGDVLGSLLDLDQGSCTFYINGQDLGFTVRFDIVNKKNKSLKLYPTLSLTGYQHVVVNFGDRQPWLYPPPFPVKLLSDCSNTRDHEVLNLQQMTIGIPYGNNININANEEEEDEYEWDGPLCTLCFSEPKNVILLPCKHDGFGQSCAKILDLCPLCRSEIKKRRVITGQC